MGRIVALNAQTHFSTKHPPEEGNTGYEKLIDFGTPRFKGYDRITCENEGGNREYEPEVFNDFIRFFHVCCLGFLLQEYRLLAE